MPILFVQRAQDLPTEYKFFHLDLSFQVNTETI